MDAEVLRSSGNTEMGGTKTGKDSCDERAEVGGEDGDARTGRGGGEREGKTASGGERLVDVKGGGLVDGGGCNTERVCRICHFGREASLFRGLELVALGCDCKGELGFTHRRCAEAWFSQKGDSRECEICGKTAANVRDDGEETSIFMMEWNEMIAVAASLDASRDSSRRCKQSFCNLLLACLVLAFLLLWFFRGINI
ncbi:E3 ubiquitin-protein ligase MARCH11-like [Sesamum indicum]|uniref:E3 ubiquitin-protein ligase MARCH11-like n=1 Tax=Sesamum indicum TaxID=4182 RepID=A0A6I9TE58_SESIN|nr:E3 ubiquitin-protein ligase MARCH11-like [Sesamum indicum]